MQKKGFQIHTLNLIQAWIHSVFYFYQIYPPQAFTKRTIYGIEVPTITSVSLKSYVEDFVKEIEDELSIINSIEIEVRNGGGLKMNEKFSILFPHQNLYNNRHQLDTQLKAFTSSMIQKFSKKQGDMEQKQFQFFIEYVVEGEYFENDGKFVDEWVKVEKSPEEGEIQCSLKLMDLNIILSSHRPS